MNLDKILFDFYEESNKLHSQGRHSELIFDYEKIVVNSLNNLGLSYSTYLKEYEKALSCFHSALKIDKSNWLLYSNLCHVYSLQGKYEESLEAVNQSIKFSGGNFFDPFYNAGVILTFLNKIPESIEMYRLALKLKPEEEQASYNLGLCLLRLGQYQEGWDLYQYRFKTNETTKQFKKRFTQDHWDGKKIKKKSLLVYSEQGLGDFIFFSRFLPMLKTLCGSVIVEVQEPLVSIVKNNFKVDEVISRNGSNFSEVKNTDYCVSVCDLPKILKIDSVEKIPSQPYILPPKKQKIKNFYNKKIKIGICWCGNPDHQKDETRSMYLEQFKPLAMKNNVQLYGLVKGVSGERKWSSGLVNLNKNIDQFPMINLADQINDFSDLSYFINHLDLVITIDSGVAHLAGAMGKPVWILLGKETDWRWGDEENVFWYPSAKLFRRKDTWENLISEVVNQLPY
jgi:tetratricopeptide (TPR) repeat protein